MDIHKLTRTRTHTRARTRTRKHILFKRGQQFFILVADSYFKKLCNTVRYSLENMLILEYYIYVIVNQFTMPV